MPTTKYIVRLDDAEREFLESVVRKGKGGAFKIRRAQILLHSDINDPSASAPKIAKLLHCREATAYGARKLLVENGFEGILERKKRATPPAIVNSRFYEVSAAIRGSGSSNINWSKCSQLSKSKYWVKV